MHKKALVPVALLGLAALAASSGCSSNPAGATPPAPDAGGGPTDSGSGHHPGTDASKPDAGAHDTGSPETDSAPPLPHGPLKGLVKVGTAEYSTGLLLDDGTVQMESGQVSPVLVAQAFPAGTVIKDYAGGLHQSVFLDSTQHLWTWGDTANGLQGSGMTGGDPTQLYQVLTDTTGADFSNIVQGAAGYAYDGAVKADGTVWVWGSCTSGIAGDGTAGGVFTKPTQVPLPSSVKVKKLVFSDIALALAEDGSVWSWGDDGAYGMADILGRTTTSGLTPGQVENLPSNIVDIASGEGYSYALTSDGTLYDWGIAAKLGDSMDFTLPAGRADRFLTLPAPVQSVAANDHTTHVILTDGTLWGWGDDAMGEVGDGNGLDLCKVGPHSTGMCSWDWGQNELMVYTPTQILKGMTFKAIFTNTAFVFYVFVETEDGHLFSFGRNKTGDLMNGIVSAAPLYGNISATYPNSWDVHTPVNVNPLEVTKNQEVTSPYCIANPTGSPCNQFNNMTGKAVYEH